ncbi:MAG: CdaR family protein [Christensenellales bacterium]
MTQANYNRVSGTAYNPHFDLSQITGEGENELSVTYYSSQLYGPVVSCEPASITVNVERYITRRVPVVLEMTGTIPEGLYLDSYKTDPTTLSVSGPQSLVASVARVVARLDQSALSERRMTDRSR